MELSEYDPRAMTREFARSLVGLSCLDDGPLQARRLLAKSGIALVVLDYLPGTHLDGAAMLRADGKPVIALTLRHDRLDNFWFTLAHEMAHVVLHLAGGDGGTFLDDLDPEVAKDRKEDEADEFAAEALIPGDAWETAEARTSTAPEAVRRLAARLHVHPAIVAGRVRFERRNYSLLDSLIGRRVVRRRFVAYKSGDVGM
jgi:HTH-type transcriptional regulator/antitoxin HigA